MSKGLEALEKIDHTVCLNCNNHTLTFNLDSYKDGPNGGPIDCKDFVEYTECYETIEKELKEYEELKSYHEFTEIVEKIHSKVCDSTLQENIRLINENTRLEQALEIIKKHELADTLFSYLKVDKTPDEWNWGLPKKMQLTQQEYDLLKEVLTDGK